MKEGDANEYCTLSTAGANSSQSDGVLGRRPIVCTCKERNVYSIAFETTIRFSEYSSLPCHLLIFSYVSDQLGPFLGRENLDVALVSIRYTTPHRHRPIAY